MTLSIPGRLAAAHTLFQVSHCGIIQHARPNLLHFSGAINQDGLRRQLKAVIHLCAGIKLYKNRQP